MDDQEHGVDQPLWRNQADTKSHDSSQLVSPDFLPTSPPALTILNRSILVPTMNETPEHKAAMDHEIEVAHKEGKEVAAGYEDPHKAALEDNPERVEKLSLSVILSALFLGTSFTGPIIFGFILATPILVQLSQKLGGDTIDFWIPSGWGAAAAVGFSIAGRLSDVFGRRYVILVGQLLTVVCLLTACFHAVEYFLQSSYYISEKTFHASRKPRSARN